MPGLDIMVPEVSPSGAPDDYERIQSSPNMFGGLRAEAQKEFGSGLTKAADETLQGITQYNQLNDQTHASELHSWGIDQAGDLVSKHQARRIAGPRRL
jgi:hypothetical protein